MDACDDTIIELLLFLKFSTVSITIVSARQSTDINPLHTKFFRGNINIYLHFVSFLHIDTAQVVEILPQIRQEPTYST